MEKVNLEQTLANSEEQILTLSQTIEQLENETENRRRTIEPDLSSRDDEQADRIEELEQKGKDQMKELRRLEIIVAESQQDLQKCKYEESVARKDLEELVQANKYLRGKLDEAGAAAPLEVDITHAGKMEQELLHAEVKRLQNELSLKEEEMSRLSAPPDFQRETSTASPRSTNLSSSMIHDVSVDDAIVVATSRPLQITPSGKGPSASSTPQKSIAKEMVGLVEGSPWMSSPFCEKMTAAQVDVNSLEGQLLHLEEVLAEKMRRLLCEQQGAQGRSSGQLMASVNQAFSEFRRETRGILEDFHARAGAAGGTALNRNWKVGMLHQGTSEPLDAQVMRL